MGHVTRDDIKAIEYVEKKALLHEHPHSKSVRITVERVIRVKKLIESIAKGFDGKYALPQEEQEWFLHLIVVYALSHYNDCLETSNRIALIVEAIK